MTAGAEPPPPVPREATSLRELLRRQSRVVRDEVIRSGGHVSDDQLARLERLARVAQLCRAVAPPRRRRWPVAAALVLTLALVSVLLFVRVPATKIELDAVVSEVGFVLASRHVLSRGSQLSALGVSGLREIRLPAEVGPELARRASDGASAGIRLSAVSSGRHTGTLNLAPVIVSAGTHVRIHRPGAARQLLVSMKVPEGAVLALGADVNGPIRVGPAGAPSENHEFSSPRAVVL